MPPRKSILSLEELCWKTALHHFRHLKRQAEYLPTVFIDELYKRLNKQKRCRILPSKLFLHPKATNLLNFSFDLFPRTEIIKKISRNCKNLRRIILPCYSAWAPPESLITITVNNPLLIHLDINGTDQFTNNYLLQISKHCPKLQHLNLKNVQEITDNCMNYLPTTLTFLDVKHTGITPHGCLIALTRLRSLKELQHNLWIEILKLLTRQRQQSTFSIECLQVRHEIDEDINLGRIVVDVFPKLRDLRLVIDDGNDIKSLRENQKLSLITCLDVHLCFQNVFLIGKLCPMLEKLVVRLLRFDLLNINDAMLDADEYVPFKQLRTLELSLGWDYNFQLADFKHLLANVKCLKSLEITEWLELGDQMIYDVVKSNLLQGIENIEFYGCDSFSVAALIQILRFTNSLKFMKISYCQKILNNQITILKKLIHDENWDVSLSHYYNDDDDDNGFGDDDNF